MEKPKTIERYYQELGKKIRRWRLLKKMTVNDFLDALDKQGLATTRQSLNNWEQGRTTLTLNKIKIIARALRVSISRLI